MFSLLLYKHIFKGETLPSEDGNLVFRMCLKTEIRFSEDKAPNDLKIVIDHFRGKGEGGVGDSPTYTSHQSAAPEARRGPWTPAWFGLVWFFLFFFFFFFFFFFKTQFQPCILFASLCLLPFPLSCHVLCSGLLSVSSCALGCC